MSQDATYILYYDYPDARISNTWPTDFEQDLKAIEELRWTSMVVIQMDRYSYFINPLKYTLTSELIASLHADQVLEKMACDPWVIIKGA